MNRRMIFHLLGRIILLEAALLLVPLGVSVYYGEVCVTAILNAIVVALLSGGVLTLVSRPSSQRLFAKEGFVIVALAWLCVSLIGALPFSLSGSVPTYVDAFFETVSGFTTTGASILTDVTSMERGLLFWRSFTHWVGGMGVLVLVMAIAPTANDRSMHILRAEIPGPIIGKLVPRARDTAKILYIIYLMLTAAEVILLRVGGMSFFESLVHSFGTAGTGGFGVHTDSIAGFSPYIQWVIAVFMMLFGVNFNLYYLMLLRQFRSVLKSGELWCYLGILLASSAIITVNIYPLFDSVGEAVRQSFFQVSSIATTTGYTTTDFNLWPSLSKTVLLLLMFVGGCAGSTAGGLKVSRVMLLWKAARRDLRRQLHPRAVGVVKLEGKRVDDQTVQSAGVYLTVYMMILAAVFLAVSFEPFDMETNLSATIACFNNVGPGFALVGPVGNYAAYSGFAKVALSFAMLFGRLEIYPLLLVLMPTTWTKK